MKKLLMTSLILAMGTMSFAAQKTSGDAAGTPQSASSNVKVTAQVVSDNLIISDLSGRPIVLDFGKISNQKTDGVSNAKVDFKIETAGPDGNLSTVAVALVGLTDGKVQLLNTNVAAAQNSKEIPASVKLNADNGTFTDNKYVGFIQGSIKGQDSNSKEASTYENVLELQATAR
ncbi:hypothetical protein [Cetobacterium sp. SF1]|uniref:hypothetical protein n=1 Tax=Cetobacterium sp. SF1 TaxID=3417654 RepID=UPI003CFBB594